MQTQSQGQHARPETQVVVNPVGWIAVVKQPWDVSAEPDSEIRGHIEISGNRIRLVLIDRRRPVNRNAAENKTEEYGQIEPVAPANHQMVPLNHEHGLLLRHRAPGLCLLRGSD